MASKSTTTARKKPAPASAVLSVVSRAAPVAKRQRTRRPRVAGALAATALPLPIGVSGLSAVTVAEADITDELTKGGPAFGSFLQAVGTAVADAQAKLDDTLVKTAKALSETQIDVIAVFEQVLDDETGQMLQGNIQKQKLPLINYLMPTAYAFSRVYLQADMKVSEFNAANGFNIKGSNVSFNASASASYGLVSGFGASGGMSVGYSSFDRSIETSTAQDSAAGSLHMEATLEPRADVQLPRPFIIQKGPRVQVRIDSSSDITGTAPSGGGDPPKIGRQVVLKATLTKSTGQPGTGKMLTVSVSDPQFSRDSVAATDGNGETSITIKNQWGTGATGEPARREALVSVSLGLASTSVGISL